MHALLYSSYIILVCDDDDNVFLFFCWMNENCIKQPNNIMNTH
jgi:hypothetical protein